MPSLTNENVKSTAFSKGVTPFLTLGYIFNQSILSIIYTGKFISTLRKKNEALLCMGNILVIYGCSHVKLSHTTQTLISKHV